MGIIEKIVLAIAIACSLYWTIQVKPPQRGVAIGIDAQIEILTMV
jgi:hypothetical protein